MSDYSIDQVGALRHKKCGGQIAIEAELYVLTGLRFPTDDETQGCQVEREPHGNLSCANSVAIMATV